MIRRQHARRRSRPRGAAGRAVLLVLGCVWWWAAVRLAVQPGRLGAVDGLVGAGGWGLSLLPVHCVPRNGRESRIAAAWRRHRSAVRRRP